MPRSPGSQRRAVLEEKAALARELLARGLTVNQIAAQLNCSRQFVRKIAREAHEEPKESPQ